MIAGKYDLHIHSCLSPCADDDMTPGNIAGMGKLIGLDVMAITDHNSTKNCPAFFEFAKQFDIKTYGGMELTTAEDIHVICLFESLNDTMAFGDLVDDHRIKIPNRPDIFGNQLIVNNDDKIVGTEEHLLINATDIAINEVADLVKSCGGFCYPAHIDKQSNSIIATLGVFPKDCGFTAFEIYNKSKLDEYIEKYALQGFDCYISSDSHTLNQLASQFEQ